MSLTTNELHRVTLLVTAEAGDDDPSGWNWQSLIDSPFPVTVERAEFVSTVPNEDDDKGTSEAVRAAGEATS